MYDPSLQLFHLHGGDQVRMERRAHHSPADHDIERALARGAQVWRCPRCEDDVIVYPPEAGPGGELPPGPER